MADFIDLANWSHDLLRRHLSSLEGKSGSENDDFVGISSTTDSAPSQYGYHDPANTALYDPTTSSVLGGSSSSSSNDMTGYMAKAGARPFFSKAAESELYMLATNFLLYVAMVIITVMVAKIYFPESLQRGRGNSFPDPATPRKYYHVRSEGDDSNKEVLDSDEDDEDAEDGEDEVEALMSGGDGNRKKTNNARTTFLDFDPERTSKNAVFQRLMFCSIMLNVTFVAWGVLQERMLTRRYPRYTGDYFTYSYALVFTNRFWTMVLSGILLVYLKPRLSRTTVLYEYTFPSISNMLSSWCQYEALRYVSFPATTLFKSFKLAPVMAMGKILGNKTYPQYDYIVALIIGLGITMFMSSTDDLSSGKDYLGGQASEAWTGIMLLLLFLFFDSFTSQFQSRMFHRHADLSMVELMFATSTFSTILSAITLVHTKELYSALEFVVQHAEIHAHFFMFSICSTIGQLLIFYTIKNFGAVVFTLIMTTRILLSIALSCFMYGHSITGTAFFGLMLVLGAVLFRIKKKAEGKQLMKWQGMDDDKGPELVQEWHEHVDM